jgi:lipoprotein-releasing system permease protein
MKFSWFLARRYLKPKRTFISIITVISFLGVALGVAVLIVVIGVMTGFEKRIKEEWLKVEPPIYLVDQTRSWLSAEETVAADGIPLWRSLLPKIRSIPGVTNASPYIHVTSLLQQAPAKEHDDLTVDVAPPSADPSAPAPAPSPPPAEEAPTGLDRTLPLVHAMIVGVDLNDPDQLDRLKNRFDELKNTKREVVYTALDENGKERRETVATPKAHGEFDLAGETVVLSQELVEKISRGSKAVPPIIGETPVNLFGPKLMNEILDENERRRKAGNDAAKKAAAENGERDYPAPEELTITGIFDDDKQGPIGYASMKVAQRLAGAGVAVDGLTVDIADPLHDSQKIADAITTSGVLPEGWEAQTWMERHRTQFEAVANEKAMTSVVLSFIVLVAGFCIMNTMITFAVQKRREIGMMRALGAKTSQIVMLFMTQGFVVGLIGVSLGWVGGRTFLAYRNEIRDGINRNFGNQIFDPKIYGLDQLPAHLEVEQQVLIIVFGLLLCTLAALPPAWMVGRMAPAKALRNDR